MPASIASEAELFTAFTLNFDYLLRIILASILAVFAWAPLERPTQVDERFH